MNDTSLNSYLIFHSVTFRYFICPNELPVDDYPVISNMFLDVPPTNVGPMVKGNRSLPGFDMTLRLNLASELIDKLLVQDRTILTPVNHG